MRALLAGGIAFVVLIAALAGLAYYGHQLRLAEGRKHQTATAAGKSPIQLSGKLAWERNWPPPDGYNTITEGSWLVGDTVVVGRPDSLAAYAVRDGEHAWTTPLDDGRYVCGMSRTARHGVGAIMVSHADPIGDSGESVASCTELMLVDVRTGEPRWTKKVPASAWGYDDIEILDDAVLAGASGYYVRAPIGDGAPSKLVLPGVDGDAGCYPGSTRPDDDGRIVYVTTCSDEDQNAPTVWMADPTTGKSLWHRQLTTQPDLDDNAVVSADPIVVASGSSFDGTGSIASLDESGNLLATISTDQKFGKLAVTGTMLAGSIDQKEVGFDVSASTVLDHQVAVHDDTIYLQGEPVPGPDGGSAVVAAFDRTTGQPRWHHQVAKDQSLLFAGADDSGVTVLAGPTVAGTTARKPRLCRLGTKDGALQKWSKPYADLATPAGSEDRWLQARATWTGEEVVMVDLMNGSRAAKPDPRFLYVLR